MYAIEWTYNRSCIMNVMKYQAPPSKYQVILEKDDFSIISVVVWIAFNHFLIKQH
jgi:hypothetical protein